MIHVLEKSLFPFSDTPPPEFNFAFFEQKAKGHRRYKEKSLRFKRTECPYRHQKAKQEISLLVFANLSVNDFSNDFAALTSARNYVNLSRPKRQIQKFCDKRKT